MVVKTDLCAFSEYRIYPGHGIKFVRRDGQPLTLSNSKCKSMVNQRKKSSLLMWTQAWRRLNKKGKDEGVTKKRVRKAAKVQRAIVGATLEDLTKKRLPTKPKPTSVATEAALKEVKDRAKKTSMNQSAARGGAVNVPKIQRGAGNVRGGAKR